MNQSTKPPKMSKKRRAVLTIMPLLLLLLCLGLINLVNEPSTESAAPSASDNGVETAVTPPNAAAPAALATLEPPTATPTTTPTATPTPPPTLPPEAVIQLLGPPDSSVFMASAPLSFYAAWPLALTEDQYLALYLITAGDEYLLGTLPEPNMGAVYHWQTQPADLANFNADFSWQIRLESNLFTDPLRNSETRAIRLIRN